MIQAAAEVSLISGATCTLSVFSTALVTRFNLTYDLQLGAKADAVLGKQYCCNETDYDLSGASNDLQQGCRRQQVCHLLPSGAKLKPADC